MNNPSGSPMNFSENVPEELVEENSTQPVNYSGLNRNGYFFPPKIYGTFMVNKGFDIEGGPGQSRYKILIASVKERNDQE